MLRADPEFGTGDIARFALDPESPEPLYRQLRRRLESSIATGVFRHGRPLPSTRYLASMLGVSRNTASIAYQELIAAGVIESRPRSGLYPVQGPRPVSLHREQPTAADPSAEGPDQSVDWSSRIRPADGGAAPHAAGRGDWAHFPFPLIPGQPEPGQFPARAWLRALGDAMSGPHARYSIQDSVDADDPLLVDALRREILPTRGVVASPAELLVTNGAQQALSLITDVLMSDRTRVAIEDPGYRDAARIFGRSGARILPVPVDGQGAVVTQAPDHDVIYLTPSHQHPTSVTLNLRRRRWILDRAAVADSLIIEDDYDSEVRFRGRPTPSLKSLDCAGRVIYVGTFSKFVAPGLRMGFVVAHPDLIAAMRQHRRYTTKHPAGHIQRALGLFIQSGEYHRALRSHRNRLKLKWEMLTESLPGALGFEVSAPAGGLSVWAQGPEGFDGTVLERKARQRGILLDGGARFHVAADAPRSAVRVGFSAIRINAIPAAMSALAEAVHDARAP